MCGAYFLQHSPTLRAHFGIASPEDLKDFIGDGRTLDPKRLFASAEPTAPSETRVFRPTDRVPFIAHDRDGHWTGFMAIWWLALDRARPNADFAYLKTPQIPVDLEIQPMSDLKSWEAKDQLQLIEADQTSS